MTNQEFRRLAGASYDMSIGSERIRKQINSLEKEMFKVWDNTKSEKYLKISDEIDRLTKEYFEELAKEGLDLRG